MLITRHTIYIDEAVPHFDTLQAPAPSDLVGNGVIKRRSRSRTILVLAAVELQVRGMRNWTLELKRGGQDLPSVVCFEIAV